MLRSMTLCTLVALAGATDPATACPIVAVSVDGTTHCRLTTRSAAAIPASISSGTIPSADILNMFGNVSAAFTTRIGNALYIRNVGEDRDAATMSWGATTQPDRGVEATATRSSTPRLAPLRPPTSTSRAMELW